MKVKFMEYVGFGRNEEEIIEYDDETTDKEIQEDFEVWVWEKVGDKFGWDKEN